MNVIISNEYKNELSTIDIDIIKNISGCYGASELVEMFRNFFYNRMILDVTALKDYNNPDTYKILADGLDQEKMVLLLPAGSVLCTPNFLARLISYGIYNFTTNANGVMYLLKKPNTHADVANIEKMATGNPNVPQNNNQQEILKAKAGPRIIRVVGFRNVTVSAGATSLVYMLRKEVASTFGQENVLGLEVNKTDFS